MAKVYDALRRAEEERRQHSDTAAQPIARLEWEPEVAPETAAVKAPKLPRVSLLRRFWPKRLADESAADFNKRRIAQLQPDSYIAEQFRAPLGRLERIDPA